VLNTPEQVDRETKRRRDSLNIEGMWKKGWSGSDLAEPPVPKKQTFPRPPAAVSKPDEVVPAPRPVSRIAPWTSSDGKVARSGNRDDVAVPTGEAPVPIASPVESTPSMDAPVDPVTPAANDEKRFDDVDAFIREQQRKWDEAVQGSP